MKCQESGSILLQPKLVLVRLQNFIPTFLAFLVLSFRQSYRQNSEFRCSSFGNFDTRFLTGFLIKGHAIAHSDIF